jgi:hypothetical protein
MAEIISLETRQRELEAQIQIGWAKVACSVLRSMAGRTIDGDPVEAMREFVGLYDAVEKRTIDPRGVAIRMPSLDRGENDPDLCTNMIVRGWLRRGWKKALRGPVHAPEPPVAPPMKPRGRKSCAASC